MFQNINFLLLTTSTSFRNKPYYFAVLKDHPGNKYPLSINLILSIK